MNIFNARAQGKQGRKVRHGRKERQGLRSVLLSLLALALAGLMPKVAMAQDAQARLIADSTPVTVGDVVSLQVEVDHPADTVVILPKLAEEWGDLEVRTQFPAVVEERADGGLTTHQQIDVTLFAPGIFQTPLLTANLTNRQGGTTEVQVPPATLVVNSLLTPADTEPRDIKPQVALGGAWRRYALPAGGALALIAALALVFWWLRGRRGLLKRTSLQRALDELDTIAAAGYPKQGRYQELYFEVTHTMRHHLEREFGMPCDERTTSELRALLRPLPLAPETSRRLLTLFQESDLVKFARVTPNEESADLLFQEARALCREVSAAQEPLPAATAPSPAPVRG